MIFSWIYRNNELLIWITALAWIFFGVDPSIPQTSFCAFHWLGLENCPGCGIGRSMHAALHGQFRASWNFHWLGLPAIIIILHRIFRLIISTKKNLHEQSPVELARPAAGRTGGN